MQIAFKEAFKNGQDTHEITARKIFKIPEGEKVSRQLRQKAKSINFGIIYGMSPIGLAEQPGINVQKAEKHIKEYFSCYPEIKTYMREAITDARAYGYVETFFWQEVLYRIHK